jgi:FKBP-type peptidyl-prolyl cis-trans isomerase
MLTISPAVVCASQEPAPRVAQTEEAASLKDDKEKSSYAVGMNLGGALRRQSPELDVNLIVQGFKDALSGEKTLLSPVEMRTILTRLQAERRTQEAGQRGEKAAKARSESEAFLAQNTTKEGVVTLESGLQYKMLKAGDGKKPTIDDTVVCHYRGTLIDGTEFDSSYKRDKPATLAVKKVVKGWAEALQLMPAGSKWQLFIPSTLAYGERGAGNSIGPNAALIFEVELISIQEASGSEVLKSQSVNTEGLLDRTVAAPVSGLAAIDLSFRVDPRVTRGLYMGDRWVRLPYTQVGENQQVTVEARAEGVDDKGKPVSVSPQWIPADPEIATVTPNLGKEVKITALRPGESTLQVISQGVSRELAVKAAYTGEVLQVEISQK